jgi:hypothetical protein
VADFEFTLREFDRLTPEALKGNALSLDLAEFRRSGGKLIIWHGWGDQAIPPTGTLDYYQRLWQRSGGLQETQDWARVFMIPTMAHCVGGYHLTEFDPFRELVSWVEHGTPPDRIIATARDTQDTVLRSRPVFPYPLRAKYDGTGSINDASNFVPTRPSLPPHDTIRWIGTDLYTKPEPVAPYRSDNFCCHSDGDGVFGATSGRAACSSACGPDRVRLGTDSSGVGDDPAVETGPATTAR